MRCQRAQQRLMAYHDSELSSGSSRRLEKHLESCAECTRLLEKLRLADRHASSAAGVNQMVGVPDMPPPEDNYWESFTARVLDRVEEDAATRAPERKGTRRSWHLFIPRMVPAFSIALVVVVAAGVLMKVGDLVPVAEAPAPGTKTVQEKDFTGIAREVSPGKAEPGEREYFKDNGVEESRRAAAQKAAEIHDTYRSGPAGATKPEPAPAPDLASRNKSLSADLPADSSVVLSPIAQEATVEARRAKSDADQSRVETYEVEAGASEEKHASGKQPILKETAEGIDESRKRQAPVVVTGADIGETKAAIEPEAAAALTSKMEDKKLLPSTPAKSDGNEIIPGEAGKVAPEPSPEIVVEPNEVPATKAAPTLQLEDNLSAAAIEDSNQGTASERDDLVQEKAAIIETQPPAPPAAAGMPENILAADITPTTRPEQAAFIAGGDVQTLEEPEEQPNEVADSAAVETSEGSKPAVSEADALESPTPLRETGQDFGSRLPYRGPEDQLIHAKNLAEVRKFWESEQVLKDLLSQRPAPAIQEDASILLVKVLSSQNRIVEAQQVLDDAKGQFPTNDMIQTYELKQEVQ